MSSVSGDVAIPPEVGAAMVAADTITLSLPGDISVACDTVDEAAALCRLLVDQIHHGSGRERKANANSLYRQLRSEIRRVAAWRRREEALENLMDAVPSAPEPFATTMEIWHRAQHPKPPYTAARHFLREWAASECGLVRVGGSTGAQWYRYDDDAW